jgi:hypothetical protein
LKRAIAFRNRLQAGGSPGAEEVGKLVEELEEQYTTAAWDLNKTFPPVQNKTNVSRVKLAIKGKNEPKRLVSLLRQEVQPQEVVLPKEEQRGWIENDEDEEDYVRSTDPLHPVSTDYSHPLDNVDDSWLLNHFTAEELQSPASNNDFGIDHSFDNVWDYGDEAGPTEKVNGANTAGRMEGTPNQWDSHGLTPTPPSFELTAWGPSATSTSSTALLGLQGLLTTEEKLQTLIEEAISSFWEVVNYDPHSTFQQSQHPFKACKGPLSSLLQSLSLDKSTSDHGSDSLANANARAQDGNGNIEGELQCSWVDGPSEMRPSPLFRRSSNLCKYDKMRAVTQRWRDTDPQVYYTKWLLLSRMEIREFVGSPVSWTILGEPRDA